MLKLPLKIRRDPKFIFAVLIIQVGLILYSQYFQKPSEIKTEQIENVDSELYKVSEVIDGDTIKLENGQTVRYIGINTPETKHPTKKVECFGNEASQKNKQLVENKMVRLQKDVSETDKFGRLLRYVYVEDVFVNNELVLEGYAYASSYPPDVKFDEVFFDAQGLAKNKNLGLWNSCSE